MAAGAWDRRRFAMLSQGTSPMAGLRLARSRRALSIVELFGCIVAIGGGIVIGAMYRGVDVKEAAVGALQYSQLAPAQPQAAAAPAAAGSQGVAAGAEGAPATLQQAITLTAEQRAEMTREYWDKLTAIMQAEAAHRAAQPE